jgi:NAD-dependent deacetylase sirtuin 1
MAKRSAEDAGMNEPQKEEDNEEQEDENVDSDVNVDEEDNEDEENNDDVSDASSDSAPDIEYIRGFALSWLEDKRVDGVPPKDIFQSLGMKVVCITVFSLWYVHKIKFQKSMDDLEEAEQWELLERVVTSEGVAHSIFRSLFTHHRHKLPNVNTFEDVVELIRNANNIVVLTGAGVSVSCGIPDFRSPGGISCCFCQISD